MMLPNLPPELVEEILSRVEVTTLTRLRSTCKLWNSLFQDKGFVVKQKHLAKQFGVLMLKDYRVCPMSVGNLHDEIHKNVAAPSIELKEGFDLKDSRSKSSDQVDVSEIFQCEGLLLCTTKDHSLVAWNPCTGQTRWIHHSLLNKRNSKFFLGYGNNKSCRNYKILRYWDDGQPCKKVTEYEIYDFSSDSWRVLNDVTCNCIPRPRGMSLKGNTYCYGLYKENHDYTFLLSFDFTTEVFNKLLFPYKVAVTDHKIIALSVVREEQLSMLLQRYDAPKVDVWVTNKIDTKAALWSKFITVDIYSSGCSMFSTYVSFFVADKEKKMAVVCEPKFRVERNNFVYIVGEDRECIKIQFEDTRGGLFNPFVKSCVPFIFNYVPSLV
ncbi:PREDICTED: putative F-box protein At3g17500 [Camelina sativa]|uniref:F-box protein At3g17500 n=1 Tax=Camelina sativa TaxID=90675 RepID=A0ABM0WAT7_CAMSA|nr:PREDICTED: putative F-box protein At3g17500 [Camelina sativa]